MHSSGTVSRTAGHKRLRRVETPLIVITVTCTVMWLRFFYPSLVG